MAEALAGEGGVAGELAVVPSGVWELIEENPAVVAGRWLGGVLAAPVLQQGLLKQLAWQQGVEVGIGMLGGVALNGIGAELAGEVFRIPFEEAQVRTAIGVLLGAVLVSCAVVQHYPQLVYLLAGVIGESAATIVYLHWRNRRPY